MGVLGLFFALGKLQGVKGFGGSSRELGSQLPAGPRSQLLAGARQGGVEPTGCCPVQCGDQTASVATAHLLSSFIAYSSERVSLGLFVYDFAAKSVDREIRNFTKASALEVMVLFHRLCSTSAQPVLALSFQLGSAVILLRHQYHCGLLSSTAEIIPISPLQPFTCHFDSSSSSCLQVQGYCQGLPTARPPASAHSEGLGCWEALVRLAQTYTVVCPM